MKGKTPSLYLRKEFAVLAPTRPPSRTNWFCRSSITTAWWPYLNGREVARHNCGPTNHFVFVQRTRRQRQYQRAIVEMCRLGRRRTGWSRPKRAGHPGPQRGAAFDTQRSFAHHQAPAYPEFRINAGLRSCPHGLPTAAPTNLDRSSAPGGGSLEILRGRANPPAGWWTRGCSRAPSPRRPVRRTITILPRRSWTGWSCTTPAPVSVNLGGWSLTDNAAEPAKWRFPTNADPPRLRVPGGALRQPRGGQCARRARPRTLHTNFD